MGNDMEFLVTIKNLGPETANNVETSFGFPDNFFLLAHESSQGLGSIISGSQIIAKLGQLAPNAQATLTISGLALCVGGPGLHSIHAPTAYATVGLGLIALAIGAFRWRKSRLRANAPATAAVGPQTPPGDAT